MGNLVAVLVSAFLVLFGLAALAESSHALSKDKALNRRERRFGPPHRNP